MTEKKELQEFGKKLRVESIPMWNTLYSSYYDFIKKEVDTEKYKAAMSIGFNYLYSFEYFLYSYYCKEFEKRKKSSKVKENLEELKYIISRYFLRNSNYVDLYNDVDDLLNILEEEKVIELDSDSYQKLCHPISIYRETVFDNTNDDFPSPTLNMYEYRPTIYKNKHLKEVDYSYKPSSIEEYHFGFNFENDDYFVYELAISKTTGSYHVRESILRNEITASKPKDISPEEYTKVISDIKDRINNKNRTKKIR